MSLHDTLQTVNHLLPAIPLKPHGKEPTITSWQDPISRARVDLPGHIRGGGNIGLVIGPDHLIMDIDPRNGGAASFKQLQQDLPAFAMLYTPTVLTAGQGAHFYFALPPGHGRRINKSLPQYPGIDWLTGNRYVVAPGSSNGTGTWRWYGAAVFPPQQILIDDLEQLFNGGDADYSLASEEDKGPLWGILTEEELATVLALINPAEHQEHDDWFQIMSACHHATAAAGMLAFLEWSTSDPSYTDAGDTISYRWQTLTAEGPGSAPITVRTLLAVLKRAAPPWLLSRLGVSTQPPAFTPLPPAEEGQAQHNSGNDAKSTTSPLQDSIAEHTAAIEATDDDVTLTSVVWPQIYTDSRLTEAMREKLRNTLAAKAGVGTRALERDIPRLAPPPQQPTEDGIDEEQGHLRVAEAVLRRLGGSDLTCYHAGDFWRFEKTHWQRVPEQSIKHMILKEARDEQYGVIVTGSALSSIHQVMVSLLPLTQEDHFNRPGAGVKINTLDGVLTLKDGTWTLSKHKPGHLLNYVIPCHYIQHSEDLGTPVYDAFMKRATDDDPQAIRILETFMVYSTVARMPWLRKSVFLHGATGSGKSVLLHLVETIIGRENRSAVSLEDFGKDFSLAQIVGKLINVAGEIDSKKPVAAMKFNQLIGGDSIQIDRKYAAPITIINSAVMWFSGNHYPKMQDSSGAAQDRVALISIPNTVPMAERDSDLRDKISKEAHRIFTKALLVFAEEYQKDQCRAICNTPQRSEKKVIEWAHQMQPLQAWVDDRIIVDNSGGFVATKALYKDYEAWSRETGHKITTYTRFCRLLQQYLPQESVRLCGDRGRYGVALRDIESGFTPV